MGNVFKEQRLKTGIMKLASLMKESNYTVVLTGAGMDTESNIPDFRSEKGWWRNIDPRRVASIDTFHENYSLFHEFYSMRLKLLEGIEPHRGHYILADLEKREIIKSIATQNVAGLHRMAGSKKVYELHGNIRGIRCNDCHHEATVKDFFDEKHCENCGNNSLRPNITLFGEMLPQEAWNTSIKDIEKSDLVIVIGTSLEVYPVNQLPMLTKGRTVFINNEDRGSNYGFHLRIIGKAKEVLEELHSLL